MQCLTWERLQDIHNKEENILFIHSAGLDQHVLRLKYWKNVFLTIRWNVEKDNKILNSVRQHNHFITQGIYISYMFRL